MAQLKLGHFATPSNSIWGYLGYGANENQGIGVLIKKQLQAGSPSLLSEIMGCTGEKSRLNEDRDQQDILNRINRLRKTKKSSVKKIFFLTDRGKRGKINKGEIALFLTKIDRSVRGKTFVFSPHL